MSYYIYLISLVLIVSLSLYVVIKQTRQTKVEFSFVEEGISGNDANALYFSYVPSEDIRNYLTDSYEFDKPLVYNSEDNRLLYSLNYKIVDLNYIKDYELVCTFAPEHYAGEIFVYETPNRNYSPYEHVNVLFNGRKVSWDTYLHRVGA